MSGFSLTGTQFIQPATMDFYVVQDPDKTAADKACMSQLAAKTASELIVCVARTDRIDEMAKRNVNEFPFQKRRQQSRNTTSIFRITIKRAI